MQVLSAQKWAQLVFGNAKLGDKRRTKRLVTVAIKLSCNTGASLANSCEGNLAF